MNIKFIPHFNNLAKSQIRVDNRLVRGGAVTCPYRLRMMKKEGITQVIDLRNSSFITGNIEKALCKLFGIKYVNFPYKHRLSSLPTQDFFERVNQQILKNKGKTYLHCQYGKRRTGICTAVYEQRYTNKTKDEIISNMINIGFQDIFKNSRSPRIIKYRQIVYDFINRFYPEDLGKKL